jgi:NAD(P)-dependent dehydrogenase (short-subunit alcohol dehydrogenase family)
MTDQPLAGKTLLMSGGSRGIGLAIALRAAADGANVALLAKTDTPHPKLEGTVHTAAEWTVPSSFGCGVSVFASSATLAPSRAARRAMARPMPRLPPDIRIVLPASFLSVILGSFRASDASRSCVLAENACRQRR